MLKTLTVLAMAGVLFWAMPMQAEMVQMADSDMDVISGKGHISGSGPGGHSPNTIEAVGDVTTSATATGDNNTQVGYFQWSDDHRGDKSLHKGANDQGGDISAVQQNVVAVTNAINWGVYVEYVSTVGTVGGSVDTTGASRGSAFIGGF